MSGDTCICCKHFFVDTGSAGYSEYTPGSEFDMACAKKKWKWEPYDSAERFRLTLLTARDCDSYELRPVDDHGGDM